jgi:hypothetical protein
VRVRWVREKQHLSSSFWTPTLLLIWNYRFGSLASLVLQMANRQMFIPLAQMSSGDTVRKDSSTDSDLDQIPGPQS